MAPTDHPVAADRVDQPLLLGRIGEPLEPLLEVQVIPAHDRVLDQSVAALGDLLTLLGDRIELAGIADGDVPG